MKLPNWNLNSLFKNDAEAFNFLTLAGVKVASFEADFKDKIIHLKPTEILTAIKQYEAISDDLGKAGSYAYLRYAINMNDEKVLILYQSISEKISEIAAKLAFFTIELNSLPESILNEEVLAFFKPFLKQNRIFKPYELSK